MKKFILQSSYFIDNSTIVFVKLFPEDPVISLYLASNHELASKLDIDLQIEDLKVEMTPILFNTFQELDSVPQSVKDQYEL
jgi:hypothetical protein